MIVVGLWLAKVFWLPVCLPGSLVFRQGDWPQLLFYPDGYDLFWQWLGAGLIIGGLWWRWRRLKQNRSLAVPADQQARVEWPRELAITAALAELYQPLISPTSTINEIAHSVLEQARNLTGSEFGYVSSIDPVTGNSIAHTLTDMMANGCQVGESKKTIIFPRGPDGRYPALWGHSLNTRQTFFTNAPQTHAAASGTPEGHVPVRQFLSVPVMLEGELVGQIALANPGRDYDDEDLVIIHRLADVYALAIQRKRLEEARKAEQELLAVTLNSIGDGVISTDAAGKIVLLNRVAEALTGWTQAEALGRSITEVFSLVDEQSRISCPNPVERVIQTRMVTGLAQHPVLIARDGVERVIAESAAPIIDKNGSLLGVVLVFRDVTEKQRLTAELLKIDKLESLSVLAGGIAHDFNNILMAILGNISLAMLYARKDDDISERLAAAEEATYRARDLVQQLLTFAKGGTPVKEVAALSELIHDSAIFACRGSQVACHFNLPADTWPVEVDPAQIIQVTQNLVINAIQAMPLGGVVTIEAENVLVDPEAGLPLKPGKYVKTLVQDQGEGIPPENLMKIFDPYFTTKPEGSGLGLATVYSIIKQHDGFITVESSLGQGTRVLFYLPALKEELLQDRKPEAELIPGEGKILVMDDEEMVRVVAGKMLTHLGYQVELAGDGAEALERYRRALEEGRPFDAVIMDLTVPAGMGGKETMKKLMEIDQDAKAIVSSGYAADPIITNYKSYGFQGCIRKPYKIDSLSVLLARVLQAPVPEDSGS